MSIARALLCIDAGNTLVKWCVHSDSKKVFSLESEFFSHPTTAFKPFDTSVDLLNGLLGGLLAEQKLRFEAVLLSNVLGAEFEQAVRSVCDSQGLSLHVLTVNSSPNIQSAYENPLSLGKDRWAACLAVSQTSNSSLNLLVSFGTATTLDAVIRKENWQHLGGFIVPGVSTMFDSLHLNTAELPKVNLSGQAPSGRWPVNTRQAIGEGVGQMQAAMVHSLMADLESQYSCKPALWLCGGFAAQMQIYLPQANLLEFAVFRGLVFDYQLANRGVA